MPTSRPLGLPIHVRWEDAGPSAHDESATTYRADSGISRTYEAFNVPPGVVRDSIMMRLTGPMRAAPRKRVTLLYRPVDASKTAEVVDRDFRSAINRAGRRKGLVHAHDNADLRSARQATEEEADGAGVVSFSVLVTVTVTDEDDVDRACTAVERAARGARFRLVPGTRRAGRRIRRRARHRVVPAGPVRHPARGPRTHLRTEAQTWHVRQGRSAAASS